MTTSPTDEEVAYEAGKKDGNKFFTDLKILDLWNELAREVMGHPLANVVKEDREELKRRVSVETYKMLKMRYGMNCDCHKFPIAAVMRVFKRGRETVLRELEEGTRKLKHVLQEHYALELGKYAEIKNGDYFLAGENHKGVTVFYQDAEQRDYAKFSVLQPDGKYGPVTRPAPTRLWDGSFHALPLNMPTRLISRKEALLYAKKTREILNGL